jgi:hypothetical protein
MFWIWLTVIKHCGWVFVMLDVGYGDIPAHRQLLGLWQTYGYRDRSARGHTILTMLTRDDMARTR